MSNNLFGRRWVTLGQGGAYRRSVKPHKDRTITSPAVKAQNMKMRESAAKCKGKERNEFLACMSSGLK